MTLIELIFAIFHICVVLTAAWIGFSWFGVIGGILGAFGGVAGLVLFYKGTGMAISLWHHWCPLRPNCKNGVCRATDYELVEVQRDFLAFRCNCGTKYVQKGHQFLEILSDGTPKRFMRKRGLGGWERDI